MSEVELILAALTAGAAAGTTAAAQAAVLDAYASLRNVVRRVLTRHGRSDAVLDTVEAESGVWQNHLADALAGVGADRDAQVLAAAQALLAIADPEGTTSGRYQVDARNSTGVQVGDHVVHVGTSYGATAGMMTGPVQISYGQLPSPPARPGA